MVKHPSLPFQEESPFLLPERRRNSGSQKEQPREDTWNLEPLPGSAATGTLLERKIEPGVRIILPASATLRALPPGWTPCLERNAALWAAES